MTEETQTAIINAISVGSTYADASEAAGIWYETFNDWINRGKVETSGKYHQFYHAVRKAEATARVRYVNVIARSANSGDWRAALEYLKRRDRATWGDNVDITSGGEKFEAVKVIEIVKANE